MHRRADARSHRSWRVARTTLDSQDEPVLPAAMTPLERMHCVWELSREVFAVAGQTGCDLPRDRWPVHVLRPAP